jgi:hypothetical protein
LVTGFAVSGESAGPTQTLRTPSFGARKLSFEPSGLILVVIRSGLPKSKSREISELLFLFSSPIFIFALPKDVSRIAKMIRIRKFFVI